MFALIATLFIQCKPGDFGDINYNPNLPSQFDTRFLYLHAVRTAVPVFFLTGTYDPWAMIYCQYISERTNIQFTNFSTQNFAVGTYYTNALKNLNYIIKLNTDDATKSTPGSVTGFCASNANQIAVCRTLKAYIFMHLTDALGMIPYSEAIKATEGNFTPKYDDQQSIYTDLNKELEEAYAQFDASTPLNSSYEILFSGNIDRWKKFNASVRMQLAIKLFKVDAATGKTNFAKAFGNGFIRNNADMLQYKYLNETANQNPFYDNMVVSARRDFQPSGTLIDTLLAFNDPRVAIYAAPNASGVYFGMPFGVDRTEAAKYDANMVSPLNTRFYQQNAPAVLITPSITLLAAAEAAERGWISDNAESLYNEAITAAFAQYGLTNAQATAYLSQPKVKYNTGGTLTERLNQIALQKWLASYMQDSFEAWADWRRLNYPNLKPGPSSVQIREIPRRRMYDSGDYNANKTNYDAAIKAQGTDALATRVWWDKQ